MKSATNSRLRVPFPYFDMNRQPSLILIAGGPGAGKTALSRELARQCPSAMLLDKDVVNTVWVDAMLGHLNGGQIDRDSKVYWEIVRPLEYSSLLAAALDNLALGKSVIAVAPFGPELGDAGWLRRIEDSVDELKGRLRTIWLETDAETARVRMSARNDARDDWKLAHWDEFSANAQFGPPRDDLFVLRNSGRTPLTELVKQASDYLRS